MGTITEAGRTQKDLGEVSSRLFWGSFGVVVFFFLTWSQPKLPQVKSPFLNIESFFLTSGRRVSHWAIPPGCIAGSGSHLVEVVVIESSNSIFIACFSTI